MAELARDVDDVAALVEQQPDGIYLLSRLAPRIHPPLGRRNGVLCKVLRRNGPES